MNIRVLSFPVFSFQFNLKNTDGEEAINNIIPIAITSIDKIMYTFIFNIFSYLLN